MRSLVFWMVMSCGFAVLAAGAARPQFVAAEIKARNGEVMFCDLNGDGLKDVVLSDATNLWVLLQQPNGFPGEPVRIFHSEGKPAIIWPAKLGEKAESLLMLSRDGVVALQFPGGKRVWLLKQTTRLAESGTGRLLMNLNLSLKTGTQWALLLVPVQNGVQVWQHGEGWVCKQTIPDAFAEDVRPSLQPPGYYREMNFRFSAADVNGDGREDLMICRQSHGGAVYELYLQAADGSLVLKETSQKLQRADWRNWFCWMDLNKDGQMDLLQGTWLDEPWFLPGTRAGKVVVSVFTADSQGRLPAKPQQVLRKNDWNPASPVLDVDGDGFPDLILAYNLFDTRESLRQMIASRKVDINLKLFFYRPGAGFAPEGEAQRKVTVHLDLEALEINWGKPPDVQRFVSFAGDFNGDGKRDMLVRDKKNQLSVFFFQSRKQGFSQEPNLQFECAEPVLGMRVLELNSDGVSDLVLTLPSNRLKIFLSRK
jgi:hypothetical protein